MRVSSWLFIIVLTSVFQADGALAPPTGLVTRSGDRSIVIHWNRVQDANFAGYRIYRATNSFGPYQALNVGYLRSPGFCDLSVTNLQTNFYRVTVFDKTSQESSPSESVAATAHEFASDDEFLEYVQQTSFDYFWYAGNPANGLVPDRSAATSPCSIAAVGFGLSAICIGVDHGWITRTQALERVLTTLTTFLQGPQGTDPAGTIGYKGWFYHFLDMTTARRYTTFDTELSSIDTALLLAGILHAKQFFSGTDSSETAVRSMADSLFDRVDWNWMARGTNVLSMGWKPSTGFLSGNWIGYNEAMILYALGLGAPNAPLPASAWASWTNGYKWSTYYQQTFVPFPPLFGHQYSHCWIDFRHIADGYMNSHNSTYFENSRRATLAQRAYCINNPLHKAGYGSNLWGLTASDSPGGYAAHGAPPSQEDDGTIAPTAAASSIPFTPEFSIPTLRNFYDQYRLRIWTEYGFRDAFNLGLPWYDPDVLGIDQGPIVIMIENYRTQRPWKLLMQDAIVKRGLERAGFSSLNSVALGLQLLPQQGATYLSWESRTGRTYQVEYSRDLYDWLVSPTGHVTATNAETSWLDDGPPASDERPLTAPARFYRVFQYGTP